MNEAIALVSVSILDKEYQVACPASERTDLLDAAAMDRVDEGDELPAAVQEWIDHLVGFFSRVQRDSHEAERHSEQ